MSEIHKYDTGYTQVLNILLYDNKLSLKAKGMYAYLFSKPNGWQFHNQTMSRDLKESREAITSAINELVESGYLTKERYRDNGILGGNVYTFLDVTCVGKPLCGKTPERENPAYNNTNISNNTKDINKYNLDELFEEWYKHYPRKISKSEAKKRYAIAYKKVGNEILLSSVKNFSNVVKNNNTEEKFIPHPSTWLNQERWEDYKPKVKTQALPMGIRKVDGYWVDLYRSKKLFSVESNPNPDWSKFNEETRSF